MRNHEDYIPELDFVAEINGKIVGNIIYTKAIELGYDCIVIFGHPGNYVSSGFISCKKCNICVGTNSYPTAMLVKQFKPDVFDGRKWVYYESPVYEINENDEDEYDRLFEPKKKEYRTSQEEFFIYSRSSLK